MHSKKRFAIFLWVFLACLSSEAFGNAVKSTPWLCGVTPNSVYACLEADSTTAATVQYGPTTAYGMSATTGSTQLTSSPNYVHNIQLTGLQPNTQYHYKVTQGTSVSADYSFWTAPLPGTPAHWGFAADSRTNIATHNTVVGQIATHAPRMMVYGGDLCASNSYSSWNTDWFVANQNALNAVSPLVNSPGNHETWGALTKAFTQSAGGDPDYFSFDYGDSHILVLNYMVSDAVGSAQWNFAAADLATSNAKFKIVIDHSPAYCVGGHGEDSEMKAMTTQIFEPNGVDLVLAGHSHFYQHNLVNGIHHMVIGSFGAPLTTPGTGSYTIYSEATECYGIIDTTAYTLTLRTYRGNGTPLEKIVIPEPATMGLLAIGALAIIRRRRK
jgi:predicted phosphodiesterase